MAHCSRSGIMPPSASPFATDPTPHIEDYLVLLLVKASFLDPHARSLTREARIPGFNQGIRHEVDAEYRKHDCESGEDRHPPGIEDELLGIIEHRPPAHHIRVT